MDIFITTSIFVLIFFHLVYILAVLEKDFGIIDVAWGLGFILVLVIGISRIGSNDTRSFILTLMVLMWGLRLSIHLFFRGRKKDEDYRYQSMRKKWGDKANLKAYFYIFLSQAFLLIIISSPILFILQSSASPLTWSDYLGIGIYLIGMYFETIADWQVYLFKTHPQNQEKLFTGGLYKYSRHPNYFGECLVWWGVFLLSIADGPILLCLIGPITISFFLMKVSGIPLIEKKRKKNPDYEAWRERTSAFIPWPPKKN